MLLGLSLTVTPLFYSYPVKIKRKGIKYFYLLGEEELPYMGVKKADLLYEKEGRRINTKVFIVISKGGLIALSPVCSHLGCLVNWDMGRSEFVCPCHGGRYDMEGRVAGGPPPAPLTRLPLEIREGRVYVGIKV